MNQSQLKAKADAAAAQKAEDAAFRQAWGQRLAELRADEVREAHEAREKARQVGPAGSVGPGARGGGRRWQAR
jgi:hypothetical protein